MKYIKNLHNIFSLKLTKYRKVPFYIKTFPKFYNNIIFFLKHIKRRAKNHNTILESLTSLAFDVHNPHIHKNNLIYGTKDEYTHDPQIFQLIEENV